MNNWTVPLYPIKQGAVHRCDASRMPVVDPDSDCPLDITPGGYIICACRPVLTPGWCTPRCLRCWSAVARWRLPAGMQDTQWLPMRTPRQRPPSIPAPTADMLVIRNTTEAVCVKSRTGVATMSHPSARIRWTGLTSTSPGIVRRHLSFRWLLPFTWRALPNVGACLRQPPRRSRWAIGV